MLIAVNKCQTQSQQPWKQSKHSLKALVQKKMQLAIPESNITSLAIEMF